MPMDEFEAERQELLGKLADAVAVAESLHAGNLQRMAEIEQLRDWRDSVTLALQRDGGARYADVPDHIRALVGTAKRYGELADAVIGPDRISVEDRDFWTHEMSVKEANNLRQNDHIRALSNCYVMARRELRRISNTGRVELIHGLDTQSVERWEHIVRFCEEAGCRLNLLRAALPTELTDGCE
jgi:hypothetical protein